VFDNYAILENDAFCRLILLYALEVCNLDKRILQSLDFTVNRLFMKLFRTSNIEIVRYCQTVFGCELSSALLGKRYEKNHRETYVYLCIVCLVKF